MESDGEVTGGHVLVFFGSGARFSSREEVLEVGRCSKLRSVISQAAFLCTAAETLYQEGSGFSRVCGDYLRWP